MREGGCGPFWASGFPMGKQADTTAFNAASACNPVSAPRTRAVNSWEWLHVSACTCVLAERPPTHPKGTPIYCTTNHYSYLLTPPSTSSAITTSTTTSWLHAGKTSSLLCLLQHLVQSGTDECYWPTVRNGQDSGQDNGQPALTP